MDPTAKMQRLQIDPSGNNTKAAKSRTKAQVAESWEEDAASDGEDVAYGEGNNAPPPTPSSPTHFPSWSAMDGAVSSSRGTAAEARLRGRDDDIRRPEKSTAVASRLIAGGLGVKAPKRTEDQRAYDRAAQEQEIRRRNREKEEAAKAKEENENAKTAVWDG